MTKAVGHFNMTTHRRRLFRYSLLTVWLPPDSIVFCPCSFDSPFHSPLPPKVDPACPCPSPLFVCVSISESPFISLRFFTCPHSFQSVHGAILHRVSKRIRRWKSGRFAIKHAVKIYLRKNPKTAPLEGKLIWWVCEQALFTSESSKFTRGYEDQILCSRIVTWKISTKWKVGTKFSSQPREYA